jgi:porphobilinogen synthase
MYSFPNTRLRRVRSSKYLNALTEEVILSASDLVYPMFIIEGNSKKEAIESMPDVYRYSIDLAIKEIEYAVRLGIKAICLFPYIDQELKSDDCKEAFSLDNLICRAIRSIKDKKLDVCIIVDIALDPYNASGHDGIVVDNKIDNDQTIEALCFQALCAARAGADALAPSDMMDGRIGAIRKILEENGFVEMPIISYCAKYASSFYEPFRSAIGSDKNLKSASKESYQMNYKNSNEALKEAELDLKEGADVLIVKPGSLYLDIIQKIKSQYKTPIFAFHVSGEYSMLKFAALNNVGNYRAMLMEVMYALKRAGSDAIITYAALDIANILNSK